MARISFGHAIVSSDPLSAIEQGVLAEKAGFDTVWVPDHIVDVDGDKLESWTVLAAISMKTKRIRLASGVTDTQRCHPSRTAHSVANLDTISGGRAVLGIGAGEAMNIIPFGLPWESPESRVLRLEEAIRVIQLLWSSSRHQPVSFEGSSFKLKDAFLSQPPKQKPHPPIFVGAFSSKKALQMIGRLGDGWYAWINTPDTFKKRWNIIRESAIAAGRSIDEIKPSTHLMMAFPRNSREKKEAMKGAKITLAMERSVLASIGMKTSIPQYQSLGVLPSDVATVAKAAEEVPDGAVEQTMAIGGLDEVEEKIDSLAKSGIRHFAIADFLAPKSSRRTLKTLAKLIRNYR